MESHHRNKDFRMLDPLCRDIMTTVRHGYVRKWTQNNTEVTAKRSGHNMSKDRGVDAAHEKLPSEGPQLKCNL